MCVWLAKRTAPPALCGEPLIKHKTTPGVNRQETIYDTTKRDYFVIKSNLHCAEHP
ncbi:hypothetical protein EXN66_Car020702 [Channa argus]|uniref:Uncharacterized protein n=1 Tax=Channa argus TaxID=215402 RepID=A0A6G1QQQ1_CHAAH|nr:hypothetical protein EXN66_Car020702 [Channa argus]